MVNFAYLVDMIIDSSTTLVRCREEMYEGELTDLSMWVPIYVRIQVIFPAQCRPWSVWQLSIN